MRIITGLKKGQKLQTLEGFSVRPTGERTKEAVFSIIQFDIEGRIFLDLFAGSGQMGIEAVSRGADNAVFIDNNPSCIKVIKNNLKKVNLLDKCEVYNIDYNIFLKSNTQTFDIVYIDPPYNKNISQDAVFKIAPFMNKWGIIICEINKDEPFEDFYGEFKLYKTYKYGKSKIVTFRHKDFC